MSVHSVCKLSLPIHNDNNNNCESKEREWIPVARMIGDWGIKKSREKSGSMPALKGRSSTLLFIIGSLIVLSMLNQDREHNKPSLLSYLQEDKNCSNLSVLLEY